jgi:hypothetical protein
MHDSIGRTRDRKALASGIVAVAAAFSLCLDGCGGGGGGGTPPGCPQGESAATGGGCLPDPAMVVTTQLAGTNNHWEGADGNNDGYRIVFNATGTAPAGGFLTSGSGFESVAVSSQGSSTPFPTPTAMTWQEASQTSITITGAFVTQLTNIQPNSTGAGATMFTATVTSAVGSPTITFHLVSGTLGGSPMATTISSGQSLTNFSSGSGGGFYALTGQGLVVDATNAYWVTGDGNIRSAPVGGGTTVTLVATGVSSYGIRGFTADASNLYWTGANGSATTSGVFKVSKAGGTVTQILATAQIPNAINNVTSAGQIVTDGTNVYFTWGVTAGGDEVVQATTSGANPTVLAASGAGQFLGLNAQDVFFANGSKLEKVPIGGGTATQIATGSNVPGPMTVDATNVYWFDGSGLQKVPAGGGPTVELIATIAGSGIAVDATNVYFEFSATQAGELGLVAISPATAPTTPTVIDSGANGNRIGFAIDSQKVYFETASTVASEPK